MLRLEHEEPRGYIDHELEHDLTRLHSSSLNESSCHHGIKPNRSQNLDYEPQMAQCHHLSLQSLVSRPHNGHHHKMADQEETLDGSIHCYSLPSSPIKPNFKGFSSMSQEDQAQQLAMVQEMVQEMKEGFVTVMEELGKIQYGDQSLQQQVMSGHEDNQQQIEQLTVLVQSLKSELEAVTSRQKGLEDKMAVVCGERHDLLKQLERNGVIRRSTRKKILNRNNNTNDFDSGVNIQHNGAGSSEGEITPPKMAPMVKPFMDSLSCSKEAKDEDGYSSESSIVAAANKSLQLSHTLCDKYMEAVTRSDHNQHNDSFDASENGHAPGDGDISVSKTQEQNDIARGEVIEEIIASESDYCTRLWRVIDDFIRPMQEAAFMTPRDLNAIFPPYLAHMYDQHCAILRRLNDRIHGYRKVTGVVVGDIFAKLTDTQENDLLTLYRDYVSDFPSVLTNLNKWMLQSAKFKTFLNRCSSSCASDITSLLLAPIQRMPQYVLLIKNLLKLTDHSHSDRYYLVASLAILRNFLNQLNDDILHSVQLAEANSKTRSGASVKSSGSSDVPNVLSARDSGVHSSVNDELIKPRPQHPRQLITKSRRHEHPDHHRHIATSQPNVSYDQSAVNRRATSPYDDYDHWRPPHDRRRRRLPHVAIPDSYIDHHPRRAGTPNLYSVPKLDLDDYYDDYGPSVPAYRVTRVRPTSATGNRMDEYDKGRVARLSHNRPRSAAAVRVYAERFRSDAETQLQDMIDTVHAEYPHHHERYYGNAAPQLRVSPDDEYYVDAARRRHHRPNRHNIPSVEEYDWDGRPPVATRNNSHHPRHREASTDARCNYGVFGENDDLGGCGTCGDEEGRKVSGADEGDDGREMSSRDEHRQTTSSDEHRLTGSKEEPSLAPTERLDLRDHSEDGESVPPRSPLNDGSVADVGLYKTNADRSIASPCIIDCRSDGSTKDDVTNSTSDTSHSDTQLHTEKHDIEHDKNAIIVNRQGHIPRRKQLPQVYSVKDVVVARPPKPLVVRPVSEIRNVSREPVIISDVFTDKRKTSVSVENIFQARSDCVTNSREIAAPVSKYTITKPLAVGALPLEGNVRKKVKGKESVSGSMSKSAEDITKTMKKRAGLKESIKSMFNKGKKQQGSPGCGLPSQQQEILYNDEVTPESSRPQLSLPRKPTPVLYTQVDSTQLRRPDLDLDQPCSEV